MVSRTAIHLKGYDCTRPGAYFATICTREIGKIFGRDSNGERVLYRIGVLTERELIPKDIKTSCELLLTKR